MTKVTLVGAGGKMGMRLTHNLKNSDYDVSYVEVNPQGIEKLKEKGVDISDPEKVIPAADAVIYAVPDVALGKVTATYIPKMKKGALVMTLDPAAALAGKLFDRTDVAYFITHHTHSCKNLSISQNVQTVKVMIVGLYESRNRLIPF